MSVHTILTIRVQAPSRQSRYRWLDQQTLKMEVCAPREKGKANEQLIADLAAHLQISRQDVQIITGYRSTIKRISIPLSLAEIHLRMP
ncbi:DUF167 domain-containing protein [Thermoflavifilum thermophilum]|uniref:Uncharacterized ACR, YggU family COG1872 n=1 Tax=Thermoflavifilum thermophilum TaxID=1393122 RepID=A0A1I7NKI9_9BACT|nr:DUF167 family protein [Thermoflavifilum thermophilum]SFV35167.1 Uncharacterised ACR, YggU family COG1872 [Thermoflavifilum thermophilum]